MDGAPHMSGEEFRRRGREVVDFIADYWEELKSGSPPPVMCPVKPGDVLKGLPEAAPERGEAWEAVMGDVRRVIMPGLTHWQHPGFFGYFPCNGSGPGVLGELLSAGLGVNGMLWATSPAATELETRVLDWLGAAIGLPEGFLAEPPSVPSTDRPQGGPFSGALWSGWAPHGGGGVIQGTASEAVLVALLAARERVRRAGGEGRTMSVYCSVHAHSSVMKAAMIAGVAEGPEDRANVRMVPGGGGKDYSMNAARLGELMRADRGAGFTPGFVVATAGTTSSMAFDNLAAIAGEIDRAAVTSPVWLHVDAAMAGAAWVCPEHRGPMAGIERADSVAFNPHKWLLTSFDCDCFWTRDRGAVTGALSITPEYLKNAGTAAGAIDYRDWQVPLGRRFRALKLWMVMRHYGLEGLRAHVRAGIAMAEALEGWVREDGRFEVAAPRHPSAPLVCFRLKGENARSAALLAAVNGSGRAFLSHTVLPEADGRGVYVLRMAMGGTFTRMEDVKGAWELIREMVPGDGTAA